MASRRARNGPERLCWGDRRNCVVLGHSNGRRVVVVAFGFADHTVSTLAITTDVVQSGPGIKRSPPHSVANVDVALS